MFVRKGYAGEKTELVKETDENGKEILEDYVVGTGEDGRPVTKKGYVWKEGRVERPDTDILYYDLDSPFSYLDGAGGRPGYFVRLE